ncbi:MAG: SdiA-regulated domain-containing protein [Phycisphaerae bacterium]|nr:SdiA-regulated domain-containing protein [Phycisphaerae bacterium]
MSVPVVASVACGLAAVLASTSFAQVAFTGSYTQDFNGLGQTGAQTLAGKGPHAIQGVLGATGVLGWYGANFLGSSANTEFKAHNGSLAGSAGRGVISFGANSSSDRALGALPTSNQISSIGLVLTNNTLETFVSLDIAYTGEQWRAGEANLPNVLTFAYGFGTSLEAATTTIAGLSFTAPNLTGGEVAIDGNAPENQTAFTDVLRGLSWRPGQSIVLRWNATELSGQDNGLGIDDLVLSATPGITVFDLADYELVATFPLPNPAALEASGVTYNLATGTLFVIGDEGLAMVEVTTEGQFVSQMALTGFEDTEGITAIGGGQFVVAEERIQDVYLLNYVAGGTVDRSALPTVSLGGTVGNSGLEGVSFDPISGDYVTVKEKNPQGVSLATIDWALVQCSTTPLFTPALGVLDLSDVQTLTTVPSLVGTADQDQLIILSQESAKLLEVTRTGEVLSSFDLSAIAGDAEGVTIGPDGTIYVVGETPALYVLKPIAARACPADLNGDDLVNGADLAILLGAWGPCVGCAADVDGNGDVNGADLAIVLGAWGGCPR